MWLSLLLLLFGCGGAASEKVCGDWNRLVATGVLVPAGTVDRLAFGCVGSVTRSIATGTMHGRWSLDNSTLTLDYGGGLTWSGQASQTRLCPNGPGLCLRLQGQGVLDIYRARY